MSRQNWESWQTQLVLPEANPGTTVLKVTAFGCFRCGTEIVAPHQIKRFGDPGSSGKTNAVWTNCELVSTTQPNEQPVWNDSKQVLVNGISCKECNNKVGSFYAKGYSDKNNGVSGPCCKLTHFRVAKNGKQIRHMVAIGSQKAVETALNNHSRQGTVSTSEEDEASDAELQELEQKLREMEMENLRQKILKKKQEKKT
eukprot:m.15549 g.15549  ORF g.15549 m.15549 type:complete len:199 (-) comp10637_c0_seq1:120-716(-)